MLSPRFLDKGFLMMAAALLTQTVSAAPVSFTKELAPILVDKCLICHQEKKAKGHYRVDTFDLLFKAGDSKDKPIVSGKADESAFFKRLITPDEDERMPQKDDALPAAQVELFKRWIAEGAAFDGESKSLSLNDLLQKKEAPKAPEKYPQALPITALVWTDDHTLCASGYHELTFWEASTGQLQRRLGGMPERILSMSLQRRGNLMAVAGGTPARSGEALIVELKTGKIIKKLLNAKDTVLAIAFSPDGASVAVGGTDNIVRLYRASDWKQLWKSEAHADWVTAVSFSPDSKQLASTSRDRTARVFRAKDGEIARTFTGHQSAIQCATFDDEGDAVLTGASDGEVRRWSWQAGEERPKDAKTKERNDLFKSRRSEVTKVIVADLHLYAASNDGTVRSYDLKKPEEPKIIENMGARVDAVALDDTAEILAIGGHSGKIHLFDLHANKRERAFIAAPGWK